MRRMQDVFSALWVWLTVRWTYSALSAEITPYRASAMYYASPLDEMIMTADPRDRAWLIRHVEMTRGERV